MSETRTDLPLPTGDDLVREAEAVRQWWLTDGARDFNGGDPGPDPRARPITITCHLDGEIIAVTFGPGGRTTMSAVQVAEALRAAARAPRFERTPSLAVTREQRRDALLREAEQVLNWLREVGSPPDDTAPVRRARNDDDAVEVTYRGARLADIRVLRRDWSYFVTEAQIEAAVKRASRLALGLDHPVVIGNFIPNPAGPQSYADILRWGLGAGSADDPHWRAGPPIVEGRTWH